MELKVDPQKIKWKHLRGLQDPAKIYDTFEELVLLFAVDPETGERLTEDEALAELDELTLEEVMAMSEQFNGEVIEYRGPPSDRVALEEWASGKPGAAPPIWVDVLDASADWSVAPWEWAGDTPVIWFFRRQKLLEIRARYA